MGTSTSSKGGSSRSPFDPEWLTKPDASDGGDLGNDNISPSDNDGDTNEDSLEISPDAGAVAPDRRFAPARTSMSAYLNGGGREALRAATKSMVSKGMGGSTRAASTMRATAQGAARLGHFLATARDATDSKVVNWVQRVREAGLSANDLILEVVQEVLPDTGSVDEDSLRNAAAEALGLLYEREPEIDIFSLTDLQIAEVIGLIVANDLCNRIDLQLGQTYEKLKFDARQIQLYRNDVKEYVHAEVRVILERQDPSKINPQRLASEVLASTLKVFVE